jgi:HEAT repeat protein
MRGTILVVVWLLVGVGGCGSGVPEESSGPPTSRYDPGAAAVTTSASAESEVRHTMRATVVPTANLDQTLTVSEWMQQAMRHPDADVRLKTLDTWVQQGRDQGLAPLMGALTDVDDRVQARALELIVQDWQRAQETHER